MNAVYVAVPHEQPAERWYPGDDELGKDDRYIAGDHDLHTIYQLNNANEMVDLLNKIFKEGSRLHNGPSIIRVIIEAAREEGKEQAYAIRTPDGRIEEARIIIVDNVKIGMIDVLGHHRPEWLNCNLLAVLFDSKPRILEQKDYIEIEKWLEENGHL